jgi:VIT1/CCC1 family predicted Fe2+/Mn2+ transporter
MTRHSLKVGISFGTTSGIITTLGLMMGLHSGTHSSLVVVGGILTIAIADAFSDALAIHISEESENIHTSKQIWISTVSTFLFKFFFASTFIFPVLIFELSYAVIINIIWGLSVLVVLSYKIAKTQATSKCKVILEHLAIALIVIAITHYIGKWVSLRFS